MRALALVALLVSIDIASAKILDSSKLKELTKQLRGDDDRLVRPKPAESTAKAQNELCPFVISSLVETVSSPTSETTTTLSVRANAAEVLHLCTTHNAANRMDIGLAENGRIFEGLKDLIHSGMKAMETLDTINPAHDMDKIVATGTEAGNAIAHASESIWILSYNNEHNQKGFFEAGIVEELIDSIKHCPVFFDRDGFCSAANMWSFAALQNLAASYCDTDTGLCDWQRNDATRALTLPKGVRKITAVDKKIRSIIMDQIKEKDDASFAKLLNYVVCAGPINSPHDGTYSWPGKATYPHSIPHPEIVPWAAVGLIKSLAIDESTRRYFSEQNEENGTLFMCLCDVFKNTPDWLEENKATIAAYRMGWDDYCPDVHDRCSDKEGWAESETKKTCSDYESERLCASMGMKLGAGIPANEACCVCGGGTQTAGSQAKLTTGGLRDFQRVMESSGYNGGKNQNCGV